MVLDEFEQNIKQRIAELEREKQEAEHRLQEAQDTVNDRENRLSHWYGALRDYQERSGLPVRDAEEGQDALDEYARLGPTQMVDLWARTHDGEVTIKDMVPVMLRVGAYKDYRSAYSSIRATITRRRDYERIGPGHYKSIQME
jgi:hypothetical protein